MSDPSPRIAVLVPCYNEEAAIAKVVADFATRRELIRSGDPWLVACAVAAAGELRLHQLTPEIQHAAENTGPDVAEVARSAVALLAA